MASTTLSHHNLKNSKFGLYKTDFISAPSSMKRCGEYRRIRRLL